MRLQKERYGKKTFTTPMVQEKTAEVNLRRCREIVLRCNTGEIREKGTARGSLQRNMEKGIAASAVKKEGGGTHPWRRNFQE